MGIKIKVLRGDQIGGCVVLVSTGQAKICIGFGENLPGRTGDNKLQGLGKRQGCGGAVF